jgi:hypothetical protein
VLQVVAGIVFSFAHSGLNLAGCLVELALSLETHVPAQLAGLVFDGAFDLLAGAFDLIFVHGGILRLFRAGKTGSKSRGSECDVELMLCRRILAARTSRILVVVAFRS